MSPPTVTLYGRRECHLCDTAHAQLRRLRRTHDFTLDVVDIESDDALHARYLERIPVIALDGEELYDLALDPDDLLARLRRS